MKMKRSTILACLLISLASPARAADPPAAPQAPASAAGGALSEADKAAARALFTEGSDAYFHKRWSQCREKLSAALRLVKYWQTAVNLGYCEQELGLHRDAAEHLSYGLRSIPADKGEDKRQEIKSLLDGSLPRVVTLTLKVDPPDAEVLLDGHSIGRGPFDAPVFLDARPHTLQVHAEGRQEHKESSDGKPGSRWEVVQSLEPVAGPPPPPPPPAPTPPPPRPPERVEPPRPSMLPAAVMAGVGVGVLSAGVALTIVGRSEGGQSADKPAYSAGLGLLSAGLLALAGASVYLVVAPQLLGSSQQAQQPVALRLQITPVAGPQGAGLLIGATF